MREKSFKNLQLDSKDIDFIYDSLKQEGMVRIYGLGVFTIKKVNARRFFHNFSNEEIKTPTHNKLHFRPFTETKKKIKKFNKYYV